MSVLKSANIFSRFSICGGGSFRTYSQQHIFIWNVELFESFSSSFGFLVSVFFFRFIYIPLTFIFKLFMCANIYGFFLLSSPPSFAFIEWNFSSDEFFKQRFPIFGTSHTYMLHLFLLRYSPILSPIVMCIICFVSLTTSLLLLLFLFFA